MYEFEGKHVLVVGGSSGVGFETARQFINYGAHVTIASRNKKKLEDANLELNNKAKISILDFTNDSSLSSFFEKAQKWDHVVITAAVTPMGSIKELTLDNAKAAMESKFWGAYRIAREVKINAGGSLTLVSGYLASRPKKNTVLQGAINAAIDGLARGLALEMAPVRVNSVSPGLVMTPLWDNIESNKRNEMYSSAKDRLPVARVGKPSDVAKAVLFLADNEYTTGSSLLIDGGGTIAN
ncbi:SDR family oxidoreductase [Brenneria izbisi]|uniref:SDR family oxidoreductase n=1 Tax=Brenneria izbisi TaxID=2939450 RepID=A0AA41XV56_9GAMM|nr:SDR family oxidoreductase [Brenneria izbisi]MCV9877504.1 SDR family oxidoreductase [Brenneria izbisi]MCV9880930.1 SDR family oxidoreductase [Brenneria izbisi]